jgi:DNA replication and repair protein RecF
MGMYGERVYEKRQQFINDFCPVFQTIYNEISGGNENVSLKYISHAQRGPLYEVIKRDRNKDRIIGYSLHGIHRDDLEMKLDDYLIRREGSQGQNKTYAIAMKLAQFDILKNTASHTTPILLLDDIFDKLDARRVERIVKLVSSNRFGQIFITDTNRDHLSQILKGNVKDYRLWTIHEGQPQKETFDE